LVIIWQYLQNNHETGHYPSVFERCFPYGKKFNGNCALSQNSQFTSHFASYLGGKMPVQTGTKKANLRTQPMIRKKPDLP